MLPLRVLQIGSGLHFALRRETPDALLLASAIPIEAADIATALDRFEAKLAPSRVEHPIQPSTKEARPETHHLRDHVRFLHSPTHSRHGSTLRAR